MKYSPAFIVLRVGWELTAGDRFEGEIKAASNFARKAWQSGQAALGFWSEIREFMRELSSATEAEVTQFLITGEFPGADKVGPAIKLAIFTAISLHVQAMEWWNGLEPYKRGYYRGYILFEVVAAVAVGLLTAPAGGAGAAVVLARHGPKLGQVLRKISEGLSRLAAKAGDNLAPIRSKLDEMVSSITGAKAAGWCFVAGTTILTAQGAVPIEQVREGGFVWSAHEETGEIGLRPVMELYRSEAGEIWTVRYAGEKEGAPVRELRCTGEHPFWTEEAESFVPASELAPGATLRLFGGEAARVLSVTPRRGPPGAGTRVYNFAVADHHTYFAGDGGVWVHNVCRPNFEKYLSEYKTFKTAATRQGRTADEAAEFAFEKVAAKVKSQTNLNEKDAQDIFRYISDQLPRQQTGSVRASWMPQNFDAFINSTITSLGAQGRPKRFIIGETQPRVWSYQKVHGRENFVSFMEIWPRQLRAKGNVSEELADATLLYNKRLIEKLHEAGFEFIDLGFDISRSVRSRYYRAELDVLEGLGVIPTAAF